MMRPVENQESSARPSRSLQRRPGLLAGLLAGLAVLITLDGPGLTIDEPLDVRPGRTYLATLRSEGLAFFSRDVVERVFRDNAEHPPLGRWLLGLASTLGEPIQILWKGPDPTGLYVLAGRLAPALAFACLAGIVAAEAARRWGPPAGFAAGWSLMVMPRCFAHGHLAALDTFLSLFWTLALLAAVRALESKRPVRASGIAGVLWSLALLTKIHAWVLGPIVAAWALTQLPPRRAVSAVALWAVVGVGLFILGWPWLWYDTLARWAAYWGTSVQRATIQVQYFGRIHADRDVPWHYPWVYFAITVPVGLQLLGLLGLAEGWRKRRSDPFPLLLAGSIVVFLVLFSTRVPVYDGERLFLHIFPSWAVLIGLGFSRFWEFRTVIPQAHWLKVGILAAQGIGILMVHPFGLSYYNLLVGGLQGAERRGLELTYWNDAVDGVLLDRLALVATPGATAALAPTLYPGQGILTTTGRLARREVILQDDAAAVRSEWVVLSRREAYLSAALVERLRSGKGLRITTRSRQGIWLSALWHFPISPPDVKVGKPGVRERAHEPSGPLGAKPSQSP